MYALFVKDARTITFGHKTYKDAKFYTVLISTFVLCHFKAAAFFLKLITTLKINFVIKHKYKKV